MKLQDLMSKISSHTPHNKYYYFDFEEFDSFGNLSIQIDTVGDYPDVITHTILKSDGEMFDFLKPNFRILEDVPHHILVGYMKYVFTYFIDDYRRVK